MPCRTRKLLAALVLGLLVALFAGDAVAAEHGQPWRIGALTSSWGPTPALVGLRDGLLALGYRENEHFVIGVRFTQGDLAALPAAARDLVHYGVDLIFADTDGPAKAAQQATSQLPIVFANVGDPVGSGLVQSFARPGRNITGVANLQHELGPKRLQVFQELVPGLKRVLLSYAATDAFSVAAVTVLRDAARRLGIELVERAVRTEAEAQATLAAVRQGEVDGLLQVHGSALNILGFTLEATARQAIPSMFSAAFMVEQGGLASYGPDMYASGHQAARLVDKIFKGVNPAEIPVEVNAKIEFVINMKTAQALGLTIAPEVLYQADRLIR